LPYFFVKEFMKVPKNYMKMNKASFYINKRAFYNQNETEVEKCCIIRSMKEREAK